MSCICKDTGVYLRSHRWPNLRRLQKHNQPGQERTSRGNSVNVDQLESWLEPKNGSTQPKRAEENLQRRSEHPPIQVKWKVLQRTHDFRVESQQKNKSNSVFIPACFINNMSKLCSGSPRASCGTSDWWLVLVAGSAHERSLAPEWFGSNPIWCNMAWYHPHDPKLSTKIYH